MGTHTPFVRCRDNYNPQTPSKCSSSSLSPLASPPPPLKDSTQLDTLDTVDSTQLVLLEPELTLLPPSPLPQPSPPQSSLPQLPTNTLFQLHVLLKKPQSSKRSSNQ